MKNLFLKLFFSPYIFTIAIRKKADRSIIDEPIFSPDYVLPASRRKWVADPILVDDGSDTYLFYEAFNHHKGVIEVVKIGNNCQTSKPTIIIEEKFHLSYPFVFREGEYWYMIPESSEANEIALYKAVEFPYKWEKQRVILEGQNVDTTVFKIEDKLFLLTFELMLGSERVVPKAYAVNDVSSFTLTQLKWNKYDDLECRGAGQVFDFDGKLIRPAQVSLENRYGDSLVFYSIQLKKDEYSEIKCSELKPENISNIGFYYDGLHTYTSSSKYEAIDIRCRKFEINKIFITIWHKFKKYFKYRYE